MSTEHATAAEALEDMDPRLAADLTVPGPIPASAVDAEGRLLPLSEVEQRSRVEKALATLAEVADIAGDGDDDESWAEVFRGIDEERPHRKLSERML
jgi:hypothetical protein